MSRIGRKPVPVPANVNVSVAESAVQVEGPKGKLTMAYTGGIDVSYSEASREVLVARRDNEPLSRSLHGLYRNLIANMVRGVTEGYSKKLEIVGVGYQAQLKKAGTVELQVGYANRVSMTAPEGVTIVVPDATHITITGPDKQKVGQFAADVRHVRPPEPYNGKGIRYEGEQVRRKAGKAFGAK